MLAEEPVCLRRVTVKREIPMTGGTGQNGENFLNVHQMFGVQTPSDMTGNAASFCLYTLESGAFSLCP